MAATTDLDKGRQLLTELGFEFVPPILHELLESSVRGKLPMSGFLELVLKREQEFREERRVKGSLRLSGLPVGTGAKIDELLRTLLVYIIRIALLSCHAQIQIEHIAGVVPIDIIKGRVMRGGPFAALVSESCLRLLVLGHPDASCPATKSESRPVVGGDRESRGIGPGLQGGAMRQPNRWTGGRCRNPTAS